MRFAKSTIPRYKQSRVDVGVINLVWSTIQRYKKSRMDILEFARLPCKDTHIQGWTVAIQLTVLF